MEKNQNQPETPLDGTDNKTFEHKSVLLSEIVEFFSQQHGHEFADLTLGGAGHSKSILSLNDNNFLVAFDQDKDAIEFSTQLLSNQFGNHRFKIHHENFCQFPTMYENTKFSGILLDLGVSSYQLDTASRGLSFMYDGPLDMRMNQINNSLTAKEIVNTFSEEKLADIFYYYGEMTWAKKLANAIIEHRRSKKIETTKDLENIVYHAAPTSIKKRKIHPATLAFQALRIEVNQELNVLKAVLEKLPFMLEENGILAIISFHSLEDRIVKHTFKKIVKEYSQEFALVNKKPIIPQELELKENPRSRSSKLRILKRINL